MRHVRSTVRHKYGHSLLCYGHGELAIGLARHDLRNGVSNCNAGLLNVLFRQARRNADLQSRLDIQIIFLRTHVVENRHRLQSRYQNPVCEGLLVC